MRQLLRFWPLRLLHFIECMSTRCIVCGDNSMAHRHPEYPYFTREICRRGVLQEPFRLIDVGVRGGIGDHWYNFGDHLQAWGFDVLYEQGVAPLIEANEHPERLHYLNIGLGDEDATRAFRF